MPSTSRGSDRTVYSPLPPPKKQTRFPGRRTSARPRASIMPKLTKAQSTLTQIDFIASTPSRSRDPIEVSSDDEFLNSRPRKRRRTKLDRKEPRQATLTQKYDLRALAGITDGPAVDDAGFEIWDDDATDDVEELRKSHASDVPEIPETSQPIIKSSPRADSGVDMAFNHGSSGLQTPRKYGMREIPSSQTPASTEPHRSAARLRLGFQRSPLKEKSANVQVKAKAPGSLESYSIGMKIASSWPSPPTVSHEQEDEADMKDMFNADVPVLPQPRTLSRTLTVQDSQLDDVNSIPPVRRAILSLQHSPRKFQRTATIQDSEYDSSEALSNSTSREQQVKDVATLEIVAESQQQGLVEDTEDADANDEQYDFDEHVEQLRQIGVETQATYDPAFSALDRDAARFGWTQTQGATLIGIMGGHEDSETDDDDLDRGCVRSPSFHDAHDGETLLGRADGDEADDVVAPEAAPAEHMPPETDRIEIENALNAGSNNDIEDADAGQDAVIPSSPPVFPVERTPILSSPEPAEMRVPPSPVHPRSSQVSTVIPTQASILHLCTDIGEDGGMTMRYADCSEASTIPPYSSSPHRLVRHHCPESQLPPPPSRSPKLAQSKGSRNTLHQAPAVEDWSLCPPPPVSSSRARTSASSSR